MSAPIQFFSGSLLFLLLVFRLQPALASDNISNFQLIYDAFLTNYGIRISHTVSADSKVYEARIIDEIDYPLLNLFVEILDQEYAKYPPGFVKRVGVRWIMLQRNLRYMQAPVEGLTGYSMVRYNLSQYMKKADDDPETFDRNEGMKEEMRLVIHHEFMHAVDQRFNSAIKNDTNWMKLQTDGCAFGDGGVSTILYGAANLTQFNNPQPGFVNLYGMSSPGEDKATILECLRSPRYAELLDEWVKTDYILANKVKHLKRFFKRIDSRFNDAFWIQFQENPEDRRLEARPR